MKAGPAGEASVPYGGEERLPLGSQVTAILCMTYPHSRIKTDPRRKGVNEGSAQTGGVGTGGYWKRAKGQRSWSPILHTPAGPGSV